MTSSAETSMAGRLSPRGPSAPLTVAASLAVEAAARGWKGEGVEVAGAEGDEEGVIEKA